MVCCSGFLSLFVSLVTLPLFLLCRSVYVLLCHLLSKCLLSDDVCVCVCVRVCVIEKESESERERVTIKALKTHENPRRAKVNLIFFVFFRSVVGQFVESLVERRT